MKVVILAGGRGLRMGDITIDKPKGLIEIDDETVLDKIIKHYSFYGHKEFIICTGYKSKMIEDYFFDKYQNLDIKCIDTGLDKGIIDRLNFIKKYLNDDFLLCYGDTLCNVNINKVIDFHHNLITLLAVHPRILFGFLDIKNNKVTNFREKGKDLNNYINGGYMVVSKDIFSYFENEKDFGTLLEKLAESGKIDAYKHEGCWEVLDTPNEVKYIQRMARLNQKEWEEYE